jgi:hypothetical protein
MARLKRIIEKYPKSIGIERSRRSRRDQGRYSEVQGKEEEESHL